MKLYSQKQNAESSCSFLLLSLLLEKQDCGVEFISLILFL